MKPGHGQCAARNMSCHHSAERALHSSFSYFWSNQSDHIRPQTFPSCYGVRTCASYSVSRHYSNTLADPGHLEINDAANAPEVRALAPQDSLINNLRGQKAFPFSFEKGSPHRPDRTVCDGPLLVPSRVLSPAKKVKVNVEPLPRVRGKSERQLNQIHLRG
jgi:hypothetical protein